MNFELRAGQCIGPSILNAIHLKLKALAEVTTVPSRHRRRRDRMLEPRASRTATAFLSIRHVIDASCISPSGIGDAKQIGSGGDANAPWVRRRVRTGRWRYSAR
jgi:hypothetical protein